MNSIDSRRRWNSVSQGVEAAQGIAQHEQPAGPVAGAPEVAAAVAEVAPQAGLPQRLRAGELSMDLGVTQALGEREQLGLSGLGAVVPRADQRRDELVALDLAQRPAPLDQPGPDLQVDELVAGLLPGGQGEDLARVAELVVDPGDGRLGIAQGLQLLDHGRGPSAAVHHEIGL
jgi:hypothetical protein